MSGRKAVGILVDANDKPANRWDAIKGRLKQHEVQPPDNLHPDGTVFGERPRIGIWLWPDNASPGELEDFVEAMIPPDDPVWQTSKEYIEAIPESERRFPPGKVLKAKLYAWLATRERPGRMGTAISARELNVDGPLAAKFADWLRRLFA